MAELTPEQRAALWQAGMLDVQAHNENPNQYEEEKLENLELIPYGNQKIAPGHPYYEKAKKYWEIFNTEKSKFLAAAVETGPETDSEFRELHSKLKSLQESLVPLLDEYMSDEKRNKLELLSQQCSLMWLFDIVQTTLGHDGSDWLIIGEYIGEQFSLDSLRDIARKESLDDAMIQYTPFERFVDEILESEEYGMPLVEDFVRGYHGCKRSFMNAYYARFGLDTPIEDVYDFYAENIRDSYSLEGEVELRWEAWKKQFFDAREARTNWVLTLFNSYIDISLAEGEQEILQEEIAEEEFHESAGYGFVYFIRNQELVKIGITGNLLRRMAQLEPDEILNVVRCKNYQELEKDLHSLFKDERIPQTEYFRLSDEQIIKVHKLMTSLADF